MTDEQQRHWNDLLEQINYLANARNYEQPSERAILAADAKLTRLRASLSQAEKERDEVRSALCRAEEAVRASLPLVIGVGAFVAGYAPPNHSEGKICPRITMETFHRDVATATEKIAARLDSAPCPHEEEAKRLKEMPIELQAELDKADVENARLRNLLRIEEENREVLLRSIDPLRAIVSRVEDVESIANIVAKNQKVGITATEIRDYLLKGRE